MIEYFVQENRNSSKAVDGIRDARPTDFAPWSRVVFMDVGSVDPFNNLTATIDCANKCRELGVDVVVVKREVLDI